MQPVCHWLIFSERSKGGFNDHTEVTPFELLKDELVKIRDVWRYRGQVRRLLAEIGRIQNMPKGSKDVTAFMPLLERLKKQLEYDVKGYPPPE